MDLNKYIGIPYKKHGRDMSGVDCYGLIVLFYKNEFNIELPDKLDYDTKFDADNSYEVLFESNKRCSSEVFIEVMKPVLGTIGLFKFSNLPHVGMYVPNNKILHMKIKSGVVLQNLGNGWLNSRLAGWYNYTGGIDGDR